ARDTATSSPSHLEDGPGVLRPNAHVQRAVGPIQVQTVECQRACNEAAHDNRGHAVDVEISGLAKAGTDRFSGRPKLMSGMLIQLWRDPSGDLPGQILAGEAVRQSDLPEFTNDRVQDRLAQSRDGFIGFCLEW